MAKPALSSPSYAPRTRLSRSNGRFAEGCVTRLKATIARIRPECDDEADGQNEEPAFVDALNETNAEPKTPARESLGNLGLTKADVADVDVDVLFRRGAVPDRPEMLRTLIRRGLAAEGLPVDADAPICPDRDEELHSARC